MSLGSGDPQWLNDLNMISSNAWSSVAEVFDNKLSWFALFPGAGWKSSLFASELPEKRYLKRGGLV